MGGEPALSCMARAFRTETAVRVAMDAVRVFGGYGCTRDYGVEKLLRDALVNLCPNDITRLDLATHL
ncbi:MAG: acyl-CoA dehydrogenase family protein [Actinomycetota bacterium]|nr:acyl-CoA dehydrogenase family protein [Actinomycetota bacterium]